MPQADRSRPPAPINSYVEFYEEMEEQGFAQVDRDFILQGLSVRPENRVRSSTDYSSPEHWSLAISQAKAQEKASVKRLVSEHGYPNTEGLDWVDAQQARLNHLMAKYPDANWDLLLQHQMDYYDRKPTPAKVMPLTVQLIEKYQRQFIATTRQAREVQAFGEDAVLAESMLTRAAGLRKALTDLGINPDVLLAENVEYCQIPSLTPENTLLIRERLIEAETLISEIEQIPPSLEDDSTDGVANPVLGATRRIADTYRNTLAQPAFSGDEEIKDEPLSLPVAAEGAAPVAASMGASTSVHEAVPTSASTKAKPGDDEKARLLTAREVADRLGIAYVTILSELKSGRFPFANRVGNQWRVSGSALEDWLAGHREDVAVMRTTPASVPKSRVKQPPKPRYIRPDGRQMSF